MVQSVPSSTIQFLSPWGRSIAKKVYVTLSYCDENGEEVPPLYLKWHLFGEKRNISREECALLELVKYLDRETYFCVPEEFKIDKYDYKLYSDQEYTFKIDFFEENHKVLSITLKGKPNSKNPFEVIE